MPGLILIKNLINIFCSIFFSGIQVIDVPRDLIVMKNCSNIQVRISFSMINACQGVKWIKFWVLFHIHTLCMLLHLTLAVSSDN